MTGADPAFLVHPDSGYFALLDEGTLIGFRSFGADGQVPGGRLCTCPPSTPAAGCARSLPGEALAERPSRRVLDYGRRRFAPEAFRVTIATFNIRAQRVVSSLGFRNIGQFQATADGRGYEILIRPEPAADAAAG